jgi:hypothetical protein
MPPTKPRIDDAEYSLLGALGTYLAGMDLASKQKQQVPETSAMEIIGGIQGELKSKTAKAIACEMVQIVNVPAASKALQSCVPARGAARVEVARVAQDILNWGYGPGAGTARSDPGLATGRTPGRSPKG